MKTRCRDCGREWTGHKQCHCARCHRHFSTVANFDAHMPGRCIDPGELERVCGAPRFRLRPMADGDTWVQTVHDELCGYCEVAA